MSLYFARNYLRFSNTNASYTHLELELNVYYGTQTTDRATGSTYNIKTKRIANVATIDMGPYVRDFIKPVINTIALSSTTDGAAWLDYRYRGYTPGGSTQTWSSYVQREVCLGYNLPGGLGYAEVSGTDQELLIDYFSGQKMIKPSTALPTVPINRNEWVSAAFTGDGTQSPGYVGSTTDSDTIISYFKANKTTYTAFGPLEIESVPYNTNHKVTPTLIYFMNRFGAYQEMWFMGGKQESLNVTGEKYERRDLNSLGFVSSGSRSVVDFNKNGRLSVTLNSGWQPEANNSWFDQLLLSHEVYIVGNPLSGYYEEFAYAARVNQNNIVFKTRERDRLINYTIQFEYTFNIIGN